MIEGLRPYPGYKVSDVPWVPLLPESWRTERAKWLFTKVSRLVQPEDEVITCFRDGTVTLRKNRRLRGFTEATAEVGYQGIRKGDLVIHAMDAFAGAVGVSDSDGKGTPVYSVCQPKAGADARYYAHIVREMSRAQWILALAKGIRERSTDFRFETFANQRVPMPQEYEQIGIVRFLDHANQKIDRFIRTKRKLIGLLNEQKQAVIERAVTRGLNPDVPLRPSGIPWLGDIPNHWKVLRAKYLFREVDERSRSGREELLSVSHITGVTPRSEKNVTMFKARSYVGHKICRPHDLVVNTMWAWMGALGVAKQEGIISPAYAVYRPRDGNYLSDGFVEMLLRTRPYTANFICRSTGVRASRLRLYPEEFFKSPIIIPPGDEQLEIIEAIAAQTHSMNDAIARSEREIKLIQEYRTRLIADIVTGKLDVREAASKLPDLSAASDAVCLQAVDEVDLEESEAEESQ